MAPLPDAYPGSRRIWRSPDGLAAIDEVEDDSRALQMLVQIRGSGSPFDVHFQLDSLEIAAFRTSPAAAEALLRDVRLRPGRYHFRRPQTDTARALVTRLWSRNDGKDRLERDDQGELWMTVDAAIGITRLTVHFRLHAGEVSRCEADPVATAALADAAGSAPWIYWVRPPRLRAPGEARQIWVDTVSQWSLEEDADGATWLTTLIYAGFTVSDARVRLGDADARACRDSWDASGERADRLMRSRGRSL